MMRVIARTIFPCSSKRGEAAQPFGFVAVFGAGAHHLMGVFSAERPAT
ncbi:hypothetical protein TevJSym_ai00700 [endosymbiont of Tevnia jerichonana (vent Tica)]|jgi:hypothetical protein|uniref:Uncharacterized protein n=1 Tax=endosymbiont of Tevnia jerichonana (vent Tica) TaxID=1049564 RepID=G2FEM1_9GAMM|nr:hypothetical protein TevJSym_ai00700 [endosymbiont of Tevnia jerichonana (vent Tica)]